MKGMLMAGALAVAALGLFSPPLNAQPDQLIDRNITRAVHRALANDESIPNHQIDVSIEDGVVILEGSVQTLRAKERAERITETVRGVRSIIARLTVVPIDRSDEAIKAEIIQAIDRDPAVDSKDINVAVDNGEVTLSGHTTSWARKMIIRALATAVPGVRALQNDITINEPERRSDEDLETYIKRRLDMSVWTYSADVDITVREGAATLSGTVGSAAQKRRVINIARMAGARSVDADRITVDSEKHMDMRRKKPPVDVSDDAIASALRDALRIDPRVDAENVGLEVDAGIVTLKGTVSTLAAKDAAERDAAQTIGVIEIQNSLRVLPIRPISDAELNKRVQEALLREPDVDRLDISINVEDGTVYLYGTTDSHFVKAQAETIASNITGVRDVNAKGLTVQVERNTKDDATIARDIRSELFWNPFVDSDAVKVNVDNGSATLAGTVSDAHERNLATHEAYEGGARVVYNNLKLRK